MTAEYFAIDTAERSNAKSIFIIDFENNDELKKHTVHPGYDVYRLQQKNDESTNPDINTPEAGNKAWQGEVRILKNTPVAGLEFKIHTDNEAGVVVAKALFPDKEVTIPQYDEF